MAQIFRFIPGLAVYLFSNEDKVARPMWFQYNLLYKKKLYDKTILHAHLLLRNTHIVVVVAGSPGRQCITLYSNRKSLFRMKLNRPIDPPTE